MPKPFDISFLGRRIRLLQGHVIFQFIPDEGWKAIELRPEWINQECTIVTSYNLSYGAIENAGKPDDSYALLFDDGNRVSWFKPSQFEIIK